MQSVAPNGKPHAWHVKWVSEMRFYLILARLALGLILGLIVILAVCAALFQGKPDFALARAIIGGFCVAVILPDAETLAVLRMVFTDKE